jgi:hypothetical protein
LKSDRWLPTKLCSLQVIQNVTTVAVLTLLLVVPRVSPAAGLSGESRTYVQSREEADKSKILGGYEYLDVAIQKIGNESVSFHTGGWLRYDFQDEQFGKRSNSDLQYSYLSYRKATGNTVVNLGRVMVFEGVAAERVDGLYARTDLAGGFGISAFGGSPVETGIDQPGNSTIYGGRLSHQNTNVYRIGVSALKEEKNSLDFRKESGVDLWVHPLAKVDFTGKSTYNGITKGWMEHSYDLMLGPFDKLRLDTTASLINYDDYFFGITSRVFTLQTGLIEPHEKVSILGETVTYSFTDSVQLAADYKNYTYDIAGKAALYGAKLTYRSGGKGGAGVAYHQMAGDTDRLKYSEYRVYGYRTYGKLEVSADVLDIAYAEPVNDVKNAYSGTLAAQYPMTETFKIGADVEYSKTPDFKSDIRTFFKLIYNFGEKGGA